MSSKRLGDATVGEVVKININGSPENFIVAHQYESETILIVQDIYEILPYSALSASALLFYRKLPQEIMDRVHAPYAFVPFDSYVNGEWEYFNSNSRRIANYSGSPRSWYVFPYATTGDETYVHIVNESGEVQTVLSSSVMSSGARYAFGVQPEMLIGDDGYLSAPYQNISDFIICIKA